MYYKVRDVDWEEAVQIEQGKACIQKYCPPSDSVPKPNLDLVLKYIEKQPLIIQFIKDGVIQRYIADDGTECTWRRLRRAVCECDGSNPKSFFDGIKGVREYLQRAHVLVIPDGAATVELMWHFSAYVPLATEEVTKMLDPEWEGAR
jgi:hypothetical protein